MFWAEIIGNELVGPFRVTDGVKMNALTYRNFLQDNFIPWDRSKHPPFRKKIIYSCKTPHHRMLLVPLAVVYLGKVGLKSEKLMTWPSSSPENQSHRVSIPLTLFMLIQILFSMCSLTCCIIIWNNGKGIFFA